MTRRGWLAATAAAVGARRLGAASGKVRVGVELYTVRSLLPKDADGTLAAVAGIGYRQVEGDRAQLVTLAPLIKKHGLTSPSAMIETALVTGNWSLWGTPAVEWNRALDSVHPVGAHYAVLGYLMPAERPKNADGRKRLADAMNAAGERCHKAGLQFAYHNHAFEFGGSPGERLIDILEERLDPKLVKLEVDVFWVSTTGNDSVEFIRRNSKRVELVHLKDKRAGSPVMYTESVKPDSFLEVGSGSIDFPAVLKAAASAGVKQYYVEQDVTAGNPLDSLRKSWNYLTNQGAV